jgi:cytochrome c553
MRRDGWSAASIGATAVVFVVSAVVGFILLPLAQPHLELAGLWDAICSAAGVVSRTSSGAAADAARKGTTVVISPDMLASADAQSIGRGATLAHQCAICHGPAGISRADSPSLSGQFATAIYKQLEDFKTGARVNAVMSPFAVNLSEQDMVDIALYYAYLPRLPSPWRTEDRPAPKIVASGAPLRGIAPCGACHGDLDNKIGAPWLGGQSAVYFREQLRSFARADRRNDINEQMRAIARHMTPEEIDEAALYYSGEATLVPAAPK